MPYIFHCNLCEKVGPYHSGTLTIELQEWKKEARTEHEMITVCDECLPMVERELTEFMKKLGVKDARGE